MSDADQDPPRDPRAVSATSALLGVEPPVTVAPDGKIVVPVDLAAVRR